MNKTIRLIVAAVSFLSLLWAGTVSVLAQSGAALGPSGSSGPSGPAAVQPVPHELAVNPLRLSFINGSVSFRRYGAEDWVEGRLNTPLAVGDSLYTGFNSDLELQGEGRAFIRADDNTQVTLAAHTQDFLQLKVTTGRVGLDLRTLPVSGYTIEINTPLAVFIVDRPGYYRVDVNSEVHFITRRGGRAVMTLPGGPGMSIQPSEEIVVRQVNGTPRAETYVAPEPNDWDRWNYDRTNYLVDSVSERYLPAGVAGARDLDQYGSWRSTNEYGSVWVPDAMPANWAPYSSGQWIWDPYYQWTWVDNAPWGWAPYHYGRWVYLGSTWAWAPGPVLGIRRPVYAPALVAFFGLSSNVSVGFGYGSGGLGWVALGWGEPLIPWWGVRGFVGQPYWGGWAGPRVVNNVVVRQTTVTNITNITYVNTRVNNAVVAAPSDRFGRAQVVHSENRPQISVNDLQHIRGPLAIKPSAANLVPDAPRAARPPEQFSARPVVTTRKPQETKLPWRTEAPAASSSPAPRAAEQPRPYVQVPRPDPARLTRPEPGTQTGPERPRPVAPAIQAPQHSAPQDFAPRGASSNAPMQDSRPMPSPSPAQAQAPAPRQGPAPDMRAAPVAPRAAPSAPAPRNLPGEPANRVYRGSAGHPGNGAEHGKK